MVIYGIPNCNTVKKAINWLKSHNIDFEFHDFKKKGAPTAQLEYWFDTFGWEKVVNKAGLTYKKLSKEEQAELDTAEKALVYLQNNTSAIKRPIIEQNGRAVVLGFNEQDYERQLLR